VTYQKQTWVDGQTPVDAAHMSHIEDGIAGDLGWTALALAAGWANVGSGWVGGRYRRLGSGLVIVEGLVTTYPAADPPVDTVIATLPAGYIPGLNIAFATIAPGAPPMAARIDVLSNGDITWNGGGYPSQWVGLAGVAFFAEQ